MIKEIYKMKIVTIIGARPQFIKAGSVSREISNHPDIKEILVHTGQHYDENMSDIFFDEMKIPKPDYFLDLGDLRHGAMTGRMIERIEEILLSENPDIILLYGDTNSTLAGAIAASKLNVKVAHVEAGLRSFNMNMPEEINRILTDRISNLLFCPTEKAIDNLKNEGFYRFNCSIVNSGDIMYDSALFYSKIAKRPDFDIPKNFILVTVHRAENTDDPKRLKEIIDALNELSLEYNIIFPVHPRTKKIIQNSKFKIQNLFILNPVGYLEMIWMLKNCSVVMTDSGGLQKEAFFFKKPCITLRDETEWTELVDNGYNILVGADKDKIISGYNKMKSKNIGDDNFYGNGNSRKVIVEKLIEGIMK